MMIVSAEQIVAVRTIAGVQLYQFLASGYSHLKWTRALREVSICDLVVPPADGYVRIPDITPWLHWVDVWDDQGQQLYWSGPITRAEQGRDWLSLSARDVSALLARTRCPLTKRWDAADPADIAAELWAAVIEHHGLNIRSLARRDPRGDRFGYDCVADETMADEVVGELVDLGLYWSVVAGIPLLGPAKREPVATLGEHDFIEGGLSVIRDGANTFNDVMLRTGDSVSRARLPMGGLNLQTIVNIDSMFGVSNADRAAHQAVRHTGTIRDAISVPEGATLHPDAPISIRELVPSVRINVEAFGLLSTMELEGVTVTCTQNETSVGVDLESVDDDLPELVEIMEAQR
ncbi:hypothetical protein KEK_08157 [Mycolicibacterium thermoresistibile ATCC 19527]|uniref:Minor tail protein n=1 Tax=Mycolicibacterium thermoresistibile (strain ATCC 19527 / DSM 44167 / CIP 105390 / JCM 6362 / NCTC 10409 / 316) TaxID=1078020 RepID=G7CF60_MYCT3|nr:hypothetical protein KEK_08157 [Mycolicibacterium thermoresistibile ATCC 19527]MCV7187050.1 hypothetical protein [Mycolicibacterium thermoresistibile]